MEFLKINKKLLPVKVHYLLLNGAHAGVLPYLPVYAKQLGITASAVGIIYAVICFITVLSKPLFGGLVDHFQKLKPMLLLLILTDVIADLGLNFIPRPPEISMNMANTTLFCYGKSSYLINYRSHNCSIDLWTRINECSLSCTLCKPESEFCSGMKRNLIKVGSKKVFSDFLFNNTTNSTEELLTQCLPENRPCSENCYTELRNCDSIIESNSPLQLCIFSILVATIYIANGSIVSLSDAACYNALDSRPHLYGKQRMWGTIGWGLIAALTGYLNQIFTGTSKLYNYSAGFYILIILFALDMAAVHKLNLKTVQTSKNICKDVGQLVVRLRIVVFIISSFLLGAATGLTRSYLFWYLRTLNANQLILGLVSGVQCFLGELPFFFFSGWIINKIGHMNTFLMSFIAYGLKFLIHSFLINPWLALLIEVLQGLCFGSFYASMTSYAKVIAPKGTEATVQGLVSGVFEGIGVATGSLLGGFGFSILGGRKTFFWAGIFFTFSGLLHWGAHFIMNLKNIDSDAHPINHVESKLEEA
ncbi:major facilitator superfamily domain-containing protein 6-like isoform X1 [Stegodyphus dumicola]|uniref:major facilitator superfamily domain-containing protein 6-like isoform X1 n=1 Tax=Stegodyphus dumicola TaxID=202533 RepID=UPI0015ACFE6C|nr:major facilitator superfamily domain-containing protein 6-like isoform X1 [Stegodyphus dumicola]